MTTQQIKSEIRSAKQMLKADPTDEREKARLEKFQKLLESETESSETTAIDAEAKAEVEAKATKAKAAKAEADKSEVNSEKKTS